MSLINVQSKIDDTSHVTVPILCSAEKDFIALLLNYPS